MLKPQSAAIASEGPTVLNPDAQSSVRDMQRTPLPPYRLAKIANALGVSMPIPASQPNANSAASQSAHRSSTPSCSSDYLRRSPTPGAGSTRSLSSHSSITSKFFLHVVPPLHLPHDSDDPENSDPLTPPPNASGYHVHFRRGTLVQVYPTLQSQLGAIAKEYALPSTNGLVLYLVTSTASVTQDQMASNNPLRTEQPGPRLSEDVWKCVWSRALKIEREESSQSSTSHFAGLGMSMRTHSSPYLPNGKHIPSSHVPLDQACSVDLSHTRLHTSHSSPVLSSPSSSSDLRSHEKATLFSSSSVSLSEPETPDTPPLSPSYDTKGALHGLELSALHSTAFIPVLAKVEFDIDPRKAAWYEPWIRSRRMHHEKRTENRSSRSRTLSTESHAEGSKKPLRDLSLIEKMRRDGPSFLVTSKKLSELVAGKGPGPYHGSRAASQGSDSDADVSENISGGDTLVTLGYEPLPDESSDSLSDGDDELEKLKELIEETSLLTDGKDPLTDTFGEDADTGSARQSNTEQVQNGADLAALSGTEASEKIVQDDTQENQDILTRKTQSHASPILGSTPKRRLSRRVPGTGRRRVPPPLVLQAPKDKASDYGSENSASSVADTLPYLIGNNTPSPEAKLLSPDSSGPTAAMLALRNAGIEKRDGGVFDDLDLGFEHLGKDEVDNQVKMKSKLDEIEKALALYSPQQLKDPQDDMQNAHLRTLSSPSLQVEGFASHMPRSRSTDMLREKSTMGSREGKWRAVPRAAVSADATSPRNPPSSSSLSGQRPPLPQLAINGVTTSAPRHFVPNSVPSLGATETDARKRELDINGADYVNLIAPSFSPGSRAAASPVIPLSPDPFGRFSSTATPPSSRPSTVIRESEADHGHSPSMAEDTTKRSSVTSTFGVNSSRFSADSSTTEETGSGRGLKGASLAGVMNLKKLWRKSSKSSVDITPTETPPPPRPSTPVHAHPSSHKTSRLSLPPMRGSSLAAAPENSVVISSPKPIRPSNVFPPLPNRRGESSMDQFHFDQESPYPVHSPRPKSSPAPALSPSVTSPTPTPPPADKSVARKSILKWKGSSSSLRNMASVQEKRASQEVRTRRPSIAGLNAILGSTSAEAPPPNPAIPEQYTRRVAEGSPQRRQPRHRPSGSGAALSEVSSTRTQSVSSVRSSRSSFDTSQFEMVSPKLVNGVILPVYQGVGF